MKSDPVSNLTSQEGDDELMIDTDPTQLAPPTSDAPLFTPVAPGAERSTLKSETRRIPIPPHRMTPLKKDWLHIFGPLTEILGLQVRMNVQRRSVEIRVRTAFSKKKKFSFPIR
jgi:RNA-binding protein PNO1